MAYLQQIATPSNNNVSSVNPEKQSKGFLSKIFNVWTGLIFGIIIVLLIIAAVLTATFSTVDSKDRDAMIRSYFAAYYLNDETLGKYADMVKNSDIRNMTASFKGTLNEIILNEKNLLLSEYGIDVDDQEEGEIALKEKSANSVLNSTLEEGRLSGTLDRVFLTELTMQVAYLVSYQSECSARTKDQEIEKFSTRMESNLKNIYDQFYNFKSPTL